MPVRTTGTSANSHSRSYAYDRRGNRTATSQDGCAKTYTSGGGSSLDLLSVEVPDSSAGCMSRFSGYSYFPNNDGRTYSLATAYYWWSATMGLASTGGSPAPGNGGLDSVYKSVTLNGTATYQYYYDAFNRRRMKAMPFDSKEEYFYDMGHQMFGRDGALARLRG